MPEALVVRGTGDPARLPAVADGPRHTPGPGEPGRGRVPRAGAAATGCSTSPRRRAGRRPAIAELVGAGRGRRRRRQRRAPAPRARRGDAARPRQRCSARRGRRASPRRCVAPRSTACSSTRRAAGSACCAGARTRGGASMRSTCRSLAELQLAMLLRRGRARATRRGSRVLRVHAHDRRDRSTSRATRSRALTGWTVLEPPAAPWRCWGPGALLLPQACGTDGMFVLGLRRGDR